MTKARWERCNLRGGDRLALSVVVILLPSGCDLIPGTAAYEKKLARGAAAQLLIDPSSAQFRNVATRETAICGEINGRNRMGAYVGFTRFWVDPSTGRAALDPGFENFASSAYRHPVLAPYMPSPKQGGRSWH